MIPTLTLLLALGTAAQSADSADSADAGSADISAPAPAVPKVLVLETGGDLADDQRIVLSNLVATRLQRFAGLRVIAQRDVQQRLGLEADKQLAGCESDAACLAELAGAFDVDLMCITAASRLGGTVVFTLQIVDERGEAKARGSVSVPALDDVAAAVATVADDAGRAVTGAEPVAATPVSSSSSSSSSLLPAAARFPLQIGGAVGLAVGLTAAGLGAIPGIMARGAEGDLRGLRVDWIESGASDDAILDAAARKQLEVDRLRGLWNTAGAPAVWGGVLVGVAGGAALAVGTLLTAEAP
jgi:hypothetical protein